MEESIYQKSENEVLAYFIQEEAQKNHLDLEPEIHQVAKIKLVLSGVFSLILFFLTATYFFHFRIPFFILILGVIPLYGYCMNQFTTVKHLIRQLKKRPDEEVGYIVYNTVADNAVKKNSRPFRWAMIALGILLPMLLFLRPHLFYEQSPDGYYVRFYTRGVFQEKTIQIPAQHRGENVVGIRGNVFAELSDVNTIILPDTITHIRGYAFADSRDLRTVQMPPALSYLGGGAFSGCFSLEKVTIPQGLTEIKGNTFEDCRSLEIIQIPQGITRIGGHAFENCTSLLKVSFPSTLEEIGGYAFANCDHLGKVVLPKDTNCHHSTFKNSSADVFFNK